MTHWIAVYAAAPVVAAVAFDRWRTLRGRRAAGLTNTTGRHRPDTVKKVDDLHLITYPALYQQYLPYIERYGYGAEQADYWCWRKARIAELRQRAAERQLRRELESDYGWLAAIEADLQADLRELVNT